MHELWLTTNLKLFIYYCDLCMYIVVNHDNLYVIADDSGKLTLLSLFYKNSIKWIICFALDKQARKI